MDDVDAEGVDGVSSDVIPVDAGDEHLALVVVDEQSADHGCCLRAGRPPRRRSLTPVPETPAGKITH